LVFLAQALKTNTSIISREPFLTQSTTPSVSRLRIDPLPWGLIEPPVVGSSQLASGEAEDEIATEIAPITPAGRERAVIEENIKKRVNQKSPRRGTAKRKEIETLEFYGEDGGRKRTRQAL